jgi:1,4-alpha-glucan branching enzyme
MRVAGDPLLRPYAAEIAARLKKIEARERQLTGGRMHLTDFASGHEYFGLHRQGDESVFRDWASHATSIFLIGDFNGWRMEQEFSLQRISESGTWELRLPQSRLKHGDLYKLSVHWPG